MMRALLCAIAVALPVRTGAAQSAPPAPTGTASAAGRLIDAARAQLEAPNPDVAAVLLERALDPASMATTAEQIRGWVLYGIAQLMKDNAAAARAAFLQALRRDPALRVDSLAFFSDAVEREFNAERAGGAVSATTFATAVDVPRDTIVDPGMGRLRIDTRTTLRARIITTITLADSPQVVAWADTQAIGGTGTAWDLRSRSGALARSGAYTLRVIAIDSTGQVALPVERRLHLSRVYADTQPADTTAAPLLPEHRRLRGGNPLWVLGGVAVGGATLNRLGCLQEGTWMCNHRRATNAIIVTTVMGVPAASLVVALRGHHEEDLPDNARRNRTLIARNAERRATTIVVAARRGGLDSIPMPAPPEPVRRSSGYWLLGGALAGHAALLVALRSDHQAGCGQPTPPCRLSRWAVGAVAAGPLLGITLYRWGPRRVGTTSSRRYQQQIEEYGLVRDLIAQANLRLATVPVRIRAEAAFR